MAKPSFLLRSVALVLLSTLFLGQPFLISNAYAEPPVGIVDLSMTQRQFCQLSQREMEALAENRDYRNSFTLEGFSNRFARGTLLSMAVSQRRRTCRLMRDLARLTSTADRRRRINEEIRWASDVHINVADSIERLKDRPQNVGVKLALQSERARLQKIADYRSGLRNWGTNNPSQGSR